MAREHKEQRFCHQSGAEHFREIERTCSRCSAFEPRTFDAPRCGVTHMSELETSPACRLVVNGWDIEWQASDVIWVPDYHGIFWRLFPVDADTDDNDFAFGFVTNWDESWNARGNLMWGSRLISRHEKIKDAARALVSAYREREGRK